MRTLLLVGLLLLSSAAARAEVYHSKESALGLAFPQADRTESRTLTLTAEQVTAIEAQAGPRPESRLVNVYEGWEGDKLLGYAFIETHNVRSLPETILVVLDPQGDSRAVHLLAFHEPPEYEPTEKWLAQFAERSLDDELALRRGVRGMAGSTLTAQAITGAVRRLMAVLQVAVLGASQGPEFSDAATDAATDTGADAAGVTAAATAAGAKATEFR